MGLEVLPGPVRAQRRTHRREQVTAPPDAGVHRKRYRDVVAPDLPGRGVSLTGALLGLGGHRHRTAGRGDPLIGIGAERGRMHVDVLARHEAVLVHQPDTVVVGCAPDARVSGDRQPEIAGHLERRLLREAGVAGYVEGELESEKVARTVAPP